MFTDHANRLIKNSIVFFIGFIFSLVNLSLFKTNRSVHIILSFGIFVIGLIVLLIKLRLNHINTVDDKIALFSIMYYYFSGIYIVYSMVIENVLGSNRIGVYIIRATLLLYVITIIIIVAKRSKVKLSKLLSFTKPNNAFYLLLGTVFIISWTLFTSYFIVPIFEGHFPNVYHFFLEWYSNSPQPTISNMFYVLICFAILPAITEESLFRGYLQSSLKNIRIQNKTLKELLVILLVSIAFMLIHGSLYSCIITIPIGIVFSMLVNITKSIKSTIFVHFVGNGFFNIFTMFIAVNFTKSSIKNTTIGMILTIILSLLMLFFISRKQVIISRESI